MSELDDIVSRLLAVLAEGRRTGAELHDLATRIEGLAGRAAALGSIGARVAGRIQSAVRPCRAAAERLEDAERKGREWAQRRGLRAGSATPSGTAGSAGPTSRAAARDRSVAEVAQAHGIAGDSGKVRALGAAYDAVYDHVAPFVVRVAHRMLPDLRAAVEADPGHRIVFVGRDGAALARAVQRLDPELSREHGSYVVVSRRLARAALEDYESDAGPTGLSWRGPSSDPSAVPGAHYNLTRYLRARGVPVGPTGGSVTIVDSSYRGTTQEILAAIYRDTRFQGAYIWHGETAGDPHPGTKKGYVQHLTPGSGGTDHIWETLAFENGLRGGRASPTRFSGGSPWQPPGRTYRPFEGVNPAGVAPPYQDPVVRDAVLDVNQRAVSDFAFQHSGQPPAYFDAGFQAFRDDVRTWWDGGQVDPSFQQFLVSFSPGPARQAVYWMANYLRGEGITGNRAQRLWVGLLGQRSLADQTSFMTRLDPGGGYR